MGPIDGNDFEAVENLLFEAKKLNESVVVHIKTKKGKGYSPAEQYPDLYHGMSPVCVEPCEKETFSKHMGHRVTSMAESDGRIVAITAAMCDGTGLSEFKEQYPQRFFDVGIAEEHALTFAAGLSANGMRPVTAIYSTFLQRGFDNIVHDLALQKLPCIIFVDRAGLNASDGATHHGIFDVAFLSQIPGMRIYTPITYEAMDRAIAEAYESHSPCAIRYPNGHESSAVIEAFYSHDCPKEVGVVCNFDRSDAPSFIVVTHGRIVEEALKAAEALRQENIQVGVILLEKIKPYDECAKRVAELLPADVQGVIFLEEEIRSGGMGMNLSDCLVSSHGLKQYKIVATDDSFVAHREIGQSIYDAAGVSADRLCNMIHQWNQ